MDVAREGQCVQQHHLLSGLSSIVGLLFSSIVIAAPPLRPIETRPSEPIDSITDLLLEANLQGCFIFEMDFDEQETAWIATADGLHAYDGYRWRRYTSADGLPSNLIRCVLKTSNGELWIGTDNGLALRDGEIFRPLDAEEGGPAGPSIRRIYEDIDGTLWFCSDQWIRSNVQGGLASFRDGRWTTYGKEDGLPSEYVSDCFRDSQGRFFVLTAEGLAMRADGEWRRPLEEQQLESAGDYFWSIAETVDGDVIAATEESIFRLKDDAWRRMPRHQRPSDLPKFDRIGDGEIMTVGDTPTRRFFRWDGSSFEPASPTFDASGAAERIVEAPDGSLWAVGYNLLVRWDRDGGEWRRWPELPPPVDLDDAGRLWFADEQQVLALTSEGWFELPDAHPSLVFGPQGEIWSYGPEGLNCHEAETPTRYEASALGLQRINACTFDSADSSLIVIGEGTEGAAAILRRVENEWRRLDFESLDGGAIVSYANVPDGGICCLLQAARLDAVMLIRITGATASRIDIPPIRTVNEARVHVDAQGGIWLYGDFGLLYRPPSANEWQRIENLPGLNVTGAVNFENAAWFTTNGISGGRPGAARYRNGEWSFFPLATSFLAGRTNSGIVLGERGRLLREDASGHLTPLQLPMDVSARTAFTDQSDRLWLDAAGDVVSFVPDGLPPKTLVIDPVREVLRGRRIPFAFEGVERYKPRAPERLEYSWRIDGGAWTEFRPLPYDGLHVELADGRHVLEARSRDQGLEVDPSPARIAFDVVPPPVQVRWWFWPLALTLFVLVTVLAMVAMASRNRIRSYAANLEGLVNERTEDLAESERRFRLLVERSPYGICELDEYGRIISVNAAAAELLSDQPEAQLTGCTFAAIAGPETLAASILTDHLHEGRSAAVEMDAPSGRQCVARLVPIRHRDGKADRFMLLLLDVTEQRLAERRQRMLMRELDHRVKNNLTAILSLVEQSIASASSLESFSAAFSGRIRALARTHDALASAKWRGVSMQEVISMIVEPYAVEQQIVMEGEELLLPARVSSPLAMTLHELTTNAVKYGALSTPQGRVRVSWETTLDTSGHSRLMLEWAEEKGPALPSAPPRAEGMGMALMEGFIRHELKGDVLLERAHNGLYCRLSIPLDLGDQSSARREIEEKR